ncbi:MAG: transcriptional regulator, ArsR family [Chloroflexi bacterium]|jgi:ArsR family transcriptional regulator|nr:transcriptional regulator, ArsR family [Chloroflexota bacterium]
MKSGTYEAETKIFKALNHPVRLAILEILREDEACVCHMEAILKLRQAYISQQLMILREAGLVQDRRDGWNIYYHVNEPRIYTVIEGVCQIAENDSLTGRSQSTTNSRQTACDCPKCRSNANNLDAQVKPQLSEIL